MVNTVLQCDIGFSFEYSHFGLRGLALALDRETVKNVDFRRPPWR
jgi:hypothetical protein